MKRKVSALLFALLLLLVACTHPPAAEEGLRLWYPGVRGASALGWESAASVPSDQLPARLLEGPQDSTLASPFPPGTRLSGSTIENGVFTALLSEEYRALTGIDRTIADACLTLTLCQLDEVDAVLITIEGGAPGESARLLRPDNFLLLAASDEPVNLVATLYFPRLEGRGLGVEQRTVLVPEGDTVSAAMAAALLAGPERDALRTLIPPGTELLEASVSDRVCTVNLSSHFGDGLGALSQSDAHLLIYSIVDTLGNSDNVSAVLLLVEGEPLPDLQGIPVSRPLEPDFRLTED